MSYVHIEAMETDGSKYLEQHSHRSEPSTISIVRKHYLSVLEHHFWLVKLRRLQSSNMKNIAILNIVF